MPTKIEFKNNYEIFFDDFKKDTGLDAKRSIAEYIDYFNARINDMNYQLNWQIGEAILKKIEESK
ncbi:MAG: hypothetical protein ABIP35_15010 [Ginsengibacter sp.]